MYITSNGQRYQGCQLGVVCLWCFTFQHSKTDWIDRWTEV